MKKFFKKVLLCFVMFFSFFLIAGCGEVKVFIENGQNDLELTVGKNNTNEILQAIDGLQKDGYEVEGVYTDEAYTNAWDSSKELTGDTNLYIKWVGREYQVNFNANGGTGTMNAQTIRYGQSVALNNNAFTREGYSFAGWATSANAETATVNNGANYTMSTKGVTLYAVWSVNTYAVNFNANGGEGSMANQEIVYGETEALTTNMFTKAGHYFNGWNTKADGTGTAYANGASLTMGAGNTSLYAVWAKEKYNFVIKNEGAEIITHENAEYAASFNIMELYGDVIAGISAPEGTVYGGLYLESDTDRNNQYLPNLSEPMTIEDFGENGDTIVLEIFWAQTEGTVALEYNGATGDNTVTKLDLTYGDTLEGLPTPTKNGKVFVGWYKSNTEYTSDTYVDTTTIWQDNFTTLYAKFVDESYTISYNTNGGQWEDLNKPTTYSPLDSKFLTPVSLRGYDFVGWELTHDAYIGNVLVPAGTVMPDNGERSYIPSRSWGNLELKAKWQIQTHTVTFKVPNASGGYDTLLVLSGESFANIDDIENYSYETLYVNMAKDGYAFDGWYTTTSFNAQDKFNNKVDGEDIILYPYYIPTLSDPTNIFVEQSSTVVTWDAVRGAEYYLVSIDGTEPEITTTNNFETGVLMSIADTYEITVQACSSYDSVLGENINSKAVKYVFTREESLQNSILRLTNEDDSFKKYIMFTGMTYSWTSPAYTVEVEELSTEGLVNVGHAQVETKTQSTLTTNSKTGTFQFVIKYADPNRDDEKYLAQVIEDVDTLAYGESYQNYLTQTDSNQTIFLDKENVTPYMVGTANGFEVDFELKKGANVYTEFNRADEELLTYAYEVKDGGVYRDATPEEIPERLADGKLKFASANEGKEYRITVKFAYSKAVSKANPFGALATQFEIKLNNAVNCHNNEELKAAYGNASVTNINILRNITAELSADQVQADGSPINVSSTRTFDSDDLTSSNATGGTERKTDGNVYKRAYMGKDHAGDNVTVNGNYCKIDTSHIPVVNVEYSASRGTGDDGVNHQIGLMSSVDESFALLRPHVGVFKYQVPYGDGATFNNLEIIGNKPSGPLGVDPSDKEAYKEAQNARLTLESGAFSGIYSETSKIKTNNVVMYNLHHGIRIDGAKKKFVEGKSALNPENWDETTPNNAKAEMNYTKISNVYNNGVYSWEGKEIKAYNCYFSYLNGPAIQMDNANDVTDPIIVIDKHTVVDNFLTGNESWFSLWGLGTLANKLKGTLQPAMENMGASVLSERKGEEATNLIFIYTPVEKVSGGILEDGTSVANLAQRSRCTTYFGGEKTVIEGETLSTGVKTVRDASYLSSSGDKRIVGGMHAFGITPVQDTTKFNYTTAVIQEILTNSSFQANGVVPYVLGVAPYSAVSAQTLSAAGGATIAQLGIDEGIFKILAETFVEYAIVREVLVGDTNNVFTTASIEDLYDTFIATLANAVGQNNDQFKALIKTKVTVDMVKALCAIKESDTAELISVKTIQTTAFTNAKLAGKTDAEATATAGQMVAMFMVMKLSAHESVGTQAVEVTMPLTGGAVQTIYLSFGFKDQEGW